MQAINNLEWSLYDYPISKLKLKYNLSDLKKNSDYNEAKIHWEHDLPKSITNPEQLEEKVKILNENIDAFFDKEVLQYVRDIQWGALTVSERTGVPPLNHVSIPNTIEQIRRHDWIEGGNTKRFERYDNNKMEYYLNGITIALVEPHLETHLSELLDILRNHYAIRQSIRLFGKEREQLLKEHGDLQTEIGDKIVSKIERKQYHTICEHCNDAAISPEP